MNSLVDQEGNKKMVNRLADLNPNSPAIWGKMDVIQMLVHCQKAVNIPFEKNNLKRNIFWTLFGSFSKVIFINFNLPFQKNLPTDNAFKMVGKSEFEKERSALISVINNYKTLDPGTPSNKSHPIFGKLSNREWDKLAWKHLDHHFRQFGI